MVYAVVEDRIDVSFGGKYDSYCFHIFYLLFVMVSQVGNTACRDVCKDLEIERGNPDRESALLVNVFGWQGREM